eukprot:m.59689 g.59689  ORF g.59689 m.59689 type:complete len:205 (-) comp7916_c0_seq2:840-1454(-)
MHSHLWQDPISNIQSRVDMPLSKTTYFSRAYHNPGLIRKDGAVAMVAAATTNVPVVAHHVLKTKNENNMQSYVVFFRDPRKRALSAFNYHRHAYGFIGDREVLKAAKTLEDFLSIDGISGCQVKQTTQSAGNACGCFRILDGVDVLHATLNLFRFIVFPAITDHFNTAVCLFHRMVTFCSSTSCIFNQFINCMFIGFVSRTFIF